MWDLWSLGVVIDGTFKGRTWELLKPLASLEGNDSVRVSCEQNLSRVPKSHPDFLSATGPTPSSHHGVMLSGALEAEPMEARYPQH